MRRIMRGLGPLLAASTWLLATTALAQGAAASSPTELAHLAERLQPGDWVWAPQIAPDGPLVVYVNLARQQATVYRNGVRVGVSTISSGKPGHETPTGVFTILQKDIDHRSSTYNNAPMPYQQRLTWDGVALHAGGLPGYPESHGCVHLPMGFARALFGATHLGATVVVANEAVDHLHASDLGPLAPIDPAGAPISGAPLGAAPWRWTPERSTSGPVTIIVSRQDQAVVVLRNGVEIGRSVADIRDNDTGTHVITLTQGDGGRSRWLYVGLPGHEDEAGRELDEATLNRVHLPAPFFEAVSGIVAPGATILVTQATVGEGGVGERLTILDAVVPAP